MKIEAKHIPPEVVEAADEVHANFKGTFKDAMSAAIAAGLAAWPEGEISQLPPTEGTFIVLPLPQEGMELGKDWA